MVVVGEMIETERTVIEIVARVVETEDETEIETIGIEKEIAIETAIGIENVIAIETVKDRETVETVVAVIVVTGMATPEIATQAGRKRNKAVRARDIERMMLVDISVIQYRKMEILWI